jgi:hypothetical protein
MANSKFLQNAKRRVWKIVSKVPPRTALTFGALGVSRYVDFTEPTLLYGLRVVNFVVVIAVFIIWGMCYFKVNANPDGQRQITVNQSDLVAPLLTDDPDAEDPKMHVALVSYDLKKLREKVQTLGTQAAVTGALHLYMGLTLPMLIQTCSIPMDMASSELFQLYILGKD